MRRVLAGMLVAGVVVGSGCQAIVAPAEEPTPTPVPVRQDEGKQTYEVQRGRIYDSVKGLGRIVSKDELPLYFKQGGRLMSVNVEIMNPVKKSDLLAELDTGDLHSRIDRARIEMEIAQVEHARQVANASNVRVDLKAAAASMIAAQAGLSRAHNDLAKLEAGPRPDELAGAQAAVAAARAAYQRSAAQLAAVKQPAPRDDVVAAEAGLQKAKSTLDKAQADYDKIAWRPEAAGSPQAVALQQATADYQAARATYNLKSQGPKPEDVAVAERAIQRDLQAIRSAEAGLAQVRAGARSEDVRAARAAVDKANAALADTRAAYEAIDANQRLGVGVADFDVTMALKKVELARVKYEGLQEELEMARIRAPFDGIITFVTGKRGEQFQAFNPVAIISDPSKLEVSAELPGTDLARVQNSQEAVITTEAFPNREIRGKVVRLPSTDIPGSGPLGQSNPRAVRISFEPPGPGAALGQLAQVTVITQQKENIILIPNTAVRRFGNRKYVQVLVDGRRRDVDVETGLVTETETEIIKGLKEGQVIIVG
ncbi:MAG TPA: efflux RND transporter periplasmic adaptor subunit [Chloroflexota bacterium]|nr:efflux RND transporter periplasmic adaptor subunit [Chloroflexota bacterium]